MIPLEYRIQNEGESAYIDFKRVPYGKEKKGELLKDILSFANAMTAEKERYIVLGVKEEDGNKEYIGVDRSEIGDEANYHQLIDRNIEPRIPFRIEYVTIDDKELAVLVIGPCADPPYVMKNDQQFLKKGNIYIRIGSSSRFATRQELDMMYQMKQTLHRRHFSFGLNEQLDQVVAVEAVTEREIRTKPSSVQRRDIKHELERRKSPIASNALENALSSMYAFQDMMSGSVPLHRKEENQLHDMLEKVDEDYAEHDNFYIFEEISDRFNLYFFNDGSEPLKNGELQVMIPIVDGLHIANTIYEKPAENLYDRISVTAGVHNFMYYPDVETVEDHYVITQSVDDLRHKKLLPLFSEDIRVVAMPFLIDQEISIYYELFVDNFPDKIQGQLSLKVVRKSDQE